MKASIARALHALVLLCGLLVAGAARADDPLPVPAGADCFEVPTGAIVRFGPALLPPLPQDFFGPGSEPFFGPVILQGGNLIGPDLVLERQVEFPIVPLGAVDPVPIQLVELQLRSVEPIIINDGSAWDVQVGLSGPTPGQLHVRAADADGGQLELDFAVQPVFTFTRTEPPFDQRVFDTGLEGVLPIPLLTTVAAPWTTEDAGDPCSVDGFAPGVFHDRNQDTVCAVPLALSAADDQTMQLFAVAPAVLPCAPPPNGFCGDATPIVGDTRVPFNTVFAPADGPGPLIRGPNVWFVYTADAGGLVRIDTCGSDFNTRLAVYDAPPCGGDQAPIATSDNAPDCDRDARVHVPVSAGQSLWIEVGGQHNLRGIGWLTVTQTFDVCDTSHPQRGPLRFDDDNDGSVDLHDVAALQRCFTGGDTPGGAHCETTFDTNRDRDIDATDALLAAASQRGPKPIAGGGGIMSAVCPAPRATLQAPAPGFAWQPCPEPDARYRLSVYRVPPGFAPADIVAHFEPEFTVDDLTQPWTPFPDSAAPLLPGQRYAWTVDAYDANDPSVQYCGNDEINVADVEVSLTDESIEELLDHLEKIRKELDDEIDDLEDNDLVKEIRLIELLGAILGGQQTLPNAAWEGLENFINCDDDALDSLDAKNLDTALKALQALIKLIIEANENLSAAQVAVLEGLHGQIEKVREGVEDLSTIKGFTSPDFDVWKYIQDKVKEGLTEAAKALAEKAIAKVAGKKAAGPIVSIALDLWNFGDALFGLSNLADLRRAWNLIMLEIIKQGGGGDLALPAGLAEYPGHVFTFEKDEDAKATWTISPVLRCWRPAEDGAAGEGSWEDCTARFDSATGPTSKTFKTEDMTAEMKGDEKTGKCRFDFTIHFDADCEGPCYFGVQVKIVRPDDSVTEFIVLLGVKPAPAD
jgi:hypothetical protein